jgi:hypothetical protein
MRSSITAIALVFVALQSAADPDLAAELARVRTQIAATVPETQRAALVQRLDRADGALKAGRTYQAAYLLEASYDGAAAFAFAASSGVRSLDEFNRKWTQVGAPKPRSRDSARVPAAIAALASVAEDRGASTYQASRPYAQDAGVEAGLYYLGESHAVMDYAAFLRSRSWPDAGRRPAFRSIASELASFDREMTTRYETMQRADHPTYIRASAALKQARSLNDRGAFEGALFQYLLSRYLFAPLRGPAAAEPTRERVDAARAAVPRNDDHSIAELFLQFAEEGLSSTNSDLRRGASAVVEDVLPAYSAAVTASRPTTTSTPTAAVTITLVRWPFT